MEEFPASGACALDHCLGEQMLIIGDAKTQCLGHWPTIQWVPKFLSIIWHTFPAVFIQFHPQLNNFSISLQQFSQFPANIFTSFSTPFHSAIFHQLKWYNLKRQLVFGIFQSSFPAFSLNNFRQPSHTHVFKSCLGFRQCLRTAFSLSLFRYNNIAFIIASHCCSAPILFLVPDHIDCLPSQ